MSKPLPLVVVGFVIKGALPGKLLKLRWRRHDSGEKPPPLVVDNPNQANSLLLKSSRQITTVHKRRCEMRMITFEKSVPRVLLTMALRPLWPGVVYSPFSPIWQPVIRRLKFPRRSQMCWLGLFRLTFTGNFVSLY